MSPAKGVLIGIIGLLMCIVSCSSFEIIQAGHRGVVTRLGAVQDEILGEGFHFVMPLVTKVYEVSVRIHKDDIQASAASKDLQEVRAILAINWHLSAKDVNRIYQEIGDREDMVSDILNPAANEAFKAATAKFSAEEILIRRVELKEVVDQTLRARLDKYGVKMNDLSIVEIEFSAEFNRSIEAKQVAEQDAKKAKFVAQQALAEAEAEVNRARGKAEAQRLLNVTLTRSVLTQNAIDKWDGHFPAVMSSEGGALPLLDMKNLTVSGAKK